MEPRPGFVQNASQFANQQIHLELTSDVKREAIFESLDRLMDLAGCRECGLAGFDLQIFGPDIISSRLSGIEGIRHLRP